MKWMFVCEPVKCAWRGPDHDRSRRARERQYALSADANECSWQPHSETQALPAAQAPAARAQGSHSTASISPLAQLLDNLQQLQTQNPAQFQQVVTQIASQLQSAASSKAQRPPASSFPTWRMNSTAAPMVAACRKFRRITMATITMATTAAAGPRQPATRRLQA